MNDTDKYFDDLKKLLNEEKEIIENGFDKLEKTLDEQCEKLIQTIQSVIKKIE